MPAGRGVACRTKNFCLRFGLCIPLHTAKNAGLFPPRTANGANNMTFFFCYMLAGEGAYGLSLYGIPAQVLLLRIPLYICIAAAESYLLWLLLRNKTISSFGGDIK